MHKWNKISYPRCKSGNYIMVNPILTYAAELEDSRL